MNYKALMASIAIVAIATAAHAGPRAHSTLKDRNFMGTWCWVPGERAPFDNEYRPCAEGDSASEYWTISPTRMDTVYGMHCDFVSVKKRIWEPEYGWPEYTIDAVCHTGKTKRKRIVLTYSGFGRDDSRIAVKGGPFSE
jgi:hypothetical protein